jgi:hypothetical protein
MGAGLDLAYAEAMKGLRPGAVKLQVELDPAMVARYRLVGYENRTIADADFRKDQVDAGEIGIGHQVTALCVVELSDQAKAAPGPLHATAGQDRDRLELVSLSGTPLPTLDPAGGVLDCSSARSARNRMQARSITRTTLVSAKGGTTGPLEEDVSHLSALVISRPCTPELLEAPASLSSSGPRFAATAIAPRLRPRSARGSRSWKAVDGTHPNNTCSVVAASPAIGCSAGMPTVESVVIQMYAKRRCS